MNVIQISIEIMQELDMAYKRLPPALHEPQESRTLFVKVIHRMIHTHFRKKTICLLLIFLTTRLFCKTDTHPVRIFVQPCEDVQFFIDTERIDAKRISRDKTLGLFELHVPYSAFELRIKKEGYLDSTIHLGREFFYYYHGMPFPRYLFQLKDKPFEFFVALDKESSMCRFVKAIDCATQPKSVCFINDYTLVVPLLEDKGFQVIDIRTGETQLICPPQKYAKYRGFVEPLFLKHKNEIWISQMSTACVHVFSATDFSYIRTIKSSGTWSKVLAFNPIKNEVYLSNWSSQDISVIDPDTYKEKKKIALTRVPRGMEVSDDGAYVYLAEFEDADGYSTGRVLKFSLAKSKIEKSLGVRGAKRHCVKDSARNLLYVSDMAKKIIEVFSLTDDSLVATIPVYDKPNTIALTADARYLIVSCRGPNNPDKGYLYPGYHMGQIHIIDTETFETVDIIEGGNQPTGLAVSPDGTVFAFSDFLDARIRVYTLNR